MHVIAAATAVEVAVLEAVLVNDDEAVVVTVVVPELLSVDVIVVDCVLVSVEV